MDEAPRPLLRKLNVAEILASLRRHRWLLTAFACVGLVIGAIQASMTVPVFPVTFKVTSIALEQSQSQVNNRISTLANLAGISLPSNANGIAFDVYLEELKGRSTANALVARPDVMHHLFPRLWDDKQGIWREPFSLNKAIDDGVKSLLGMPGDSFHPPGPAQVQGLLESSISVSKSPYTPVVTITLLTADPKWGTQFLPLLHGIVDESLRRKTLERANRYIAYLMDQLGSATVGDYRAALIATLIEQQRQRMAASADLSFAASPVDEPVASPIPVTPSVFNRLLQAMILAFLAGCIVAIALDNGILGLAPLPETIVHRYVARVNSGRGQMKPGTAAMGQP